MNIKMAMATFSVLACVAIPALSADTRGDVEKATAELVVRYPAGSIDSMEKSEQALKEVAPQRAAIDALFANEQNECLQSFFVNACTDKAKQRHKIALKQVNSIEVEANAFQRKQRVVERDKAMAERAAQDEQEKPARQKQEQENEAAAAQKAASVQKAMEAKPKDSAAVPDKRRAEHEAKLKQQRAQEAADAKKRAENVAEYETKVKEAQEHQREVAERKQEKEKDRAAKGATAPSPAPVPTPPAK